MEVKRKIGRKNTRRPAGQAILLSAGCGSGVGSAIGRRSRFGTAKGRFSLRLCTGTKAGIGRNPAFGSRNEDK